jgi:serine/threonine protein kinase
MVLAPGTRLGSYEIASAIGAGGMGEVYRARDTKLDRHVALKILPPSFVADPDRLMRFEREAKTLAMLNHPHIAQIHGVDESAGVRALVMELVEGEDLAHRIARGPLLLDEALAIGRQLADALETAHDRRTDSTSCTSATRGSALDARTGAASASSCSRGSCPGVHRPFLRTAGCSCSFAKTRQGHRSSG